MGDIDPGAEVTAEPTGEPAAESQTAEPAPTGEPAAAAQPAAPVETPAVKEFAPITSQEDFEKRLGGRLAQERKKYEDYDQLKEKAAEYDKYVESQKTEAQKNAERLAALEKENETLKFEKLRDKVAQEKKLPAKLAARLRGATQAELEADADELLEAMPKAATPPATGMPEPVGGGAPKPADAPFDIEAELKKIPRT